MPLMQEQGTFQRKDEEISADVITVKINAEERAMLEEMKKILEQDKDSTALKQLATMGAKVLLSPEIGYILQTVFANKRKNRRLGIVQYELT